jgi:hypothetical protein
MKFKGGRSVNRSAEQGSRQSKATGRPCFETRKNSGRNKINIQKLACEGKTCIYVGRTVGGGCHHRQSGRAFVARAQPERFSLKSGAPFGELGIDEKTKSTVSLGGEPNGIASN